MWANGTTNWYNNVIYSAAIAIQFIQQTMHTITNYNYYYIRQMYDFMFSYLPFAPVVGDHFNYYYFLLFDCTLNTKQITTTIKTTKTQMSNGYYTIDRAEGGYIDAGDDDGNGEDDGVERSEENCKDVIDNNNYKTLDKIYYINTREV